MNVWVRVGASVIGSNSRARKRTERQEFAHLHPKFHILREPHELDINM